jgi:hypothetical protein
MIVHLDTRDLLPYIEQDVHAVISSKVTAVNDLTDQKNQERATESDDSSPGGQSAPELPTIESLLDRAKDIKDWTRTQKRRNSKAIALIMGSIDSIRLSLIEALDSAFKQWEILEKAYTPAGGTQLNTLSAKFHSYKLRSGISVVEAASELSNIQTDIRSVDPEEAPTEHRKANKLMELFLVSNDRYEPAVFMIQSKNGKADYTETVSVLSQVEEQINSSKSMTTRVVDTAMATRMALKKPFYKGKL